MADIFEKATKMKLRFATPKGNLSVEDLWDLPLRGRPGVVTLDNVAIATNKKIKEYSEESFVSKKTTVDSILQLQLDLLKRVIEVRLEDEKKALTRQQTAIQKRRIKELIAQKKDEGLVSKTEDELQALLKALASDETEE